MNIAIVYDSSTGTTAKAAEAMGKAMEAHGHSCRVQPIASADPAEPTTIATPSIGPTSNSI